MEKNKTLLFSNVTELQKVISVERKPEEKNFSSKSSAALNIIAVFMLILTACLFCLKQINFAVGLIIFAAVGIGNVILKNFFAKQKREMEQSSYSVHKLGENVVWHYDFYDEFFTARIEDKDNSEKIINYCGIEAVRDAGNSYQLKSCQMTSCHLTSGENYTIKKSGFHGEDEQRFVDIMKKNGVGKLLRDVEKY